jgi:hypothetical protein
MKYLTDNFGIEEYKAPSTVPKELELAPIEYDFAPIDFDSEDDFNTFETDLYSKDSRIPEKLGLQEEASRDYANNSGIEYFDYFDYYHSKPENNETEATIPTSKEVVEELKDMGNSLLDSTKDKVNNVVTTIAELEPVKDKPEIHVIDDQFSGTIDVFPVAEGYAQEIQNMNNYKITNNSNRSSIGGFFK